MNIIFPDWNRADQVLTKVVNENFNLIIKVDKSNLTNDNPISIKLEFLSDYNSIKEVIPMKYFIKFMDCYFNFVRDICIIFQDPINQLSAKYFTDIDKIRQSDAAEITMLINEFEFKAMGMYQKYEIGNNITFKEIFLMSYLKVFSRVKESIINPLFPEWKDANIILQKWITDSFKPKVEFSNPYGYIKIPFNFSLLANDCINIIPSGYLDTFSNIYIKFINDIDKRLQFTAEINRTLSFLPVLSKDRILDIAQDTLNTLIRKEELKNNINLVDVFLHDYLKIF